MIGRLTHIIEVLKRINATGEITGEDADDVLAAALAINLEYLKREFAGMRVQKERLLMERVERILVDLAQKEQR